MIRKQRSTSRTPMSALAPTASGDQSLPPRFHAGCGPDSSESSSCLRFHSGGAVRRLSWLTQMQDSMLCHSLCGEMHAFTDNSSQPHFTCTLHVYVQGQFSHSCSSTGIVHRAGRRTVCAHTGPVQAEGTRGTQCGSHRYICARVQLNAVQQLANFIM